VCSEKDLETTNICRNMSYGLVKAEKRICAVYIHKLLVSYAYNLRPLSLIRLMASATDIAVLSDSLRPMSAAPSSRLKRPKHKAGEPVQ
jgi:hypothetical protein